MFNRSKKDVAPSARSGLPLARAQRLNAQTNRIARYKTNRITTMSLLAIGSIVFFGAHPTASARVNGAISAAGDGASVSEIVATFNQPGTPVAVTETAETLVSAEARADDVLATSVAPEPAIVPLAPVRVVDEPVVETVAVEPADVASPAEPLFTAQMDAPACVVEIEQALEALLQAGDAPLMWSESEAQISEIVQNGLECPDAGVRMAGSLELARTDFAHLRFRWDRDTRVIDVATVNSADVGETDTVVATDTSLEIVFR